MKFNRVFVLMMLTLALAACGAGGTDVTQAPATTAPSSDATAAPATDATAAPSDSGSGSFDFSKFPAPPSGSAIKQGDDPTFDMLISQMGPAMSEAAKSNGGKTSEPVYFKTSASLEEISAFYKKELPGMGLNAAPGSDAASATPGMASMIYLDESMTTGVVVMAFEGKQFMAEENLVMAVGISQ